MKRIVLVNCIDIDEFRESTKDELPMILIGSEFKMDDMDVCMFVDDNPKVVDAAEKFLKMNNVRYFIDKSYDIHTMEELADYINAHEGWEMGAYTAIHRNGWQDDTGEDYGVCSNDKKKVVINEQGQAEVTTL